MTAHVTQDWEVNMEGNFIREVESCVEVIHKPGDDDIWTCSKCGHQDAGETFLKN